MSTVALACPIDLIAACLADFGAAELERGTGSIRMSLPVPLTDGRQPVFVLDVTVTGAEEVTVREVAHAGKGTSGLRSCITATRSFMIPGRCSNAARTSATFVSSFPNCHLLSSLFPCASGRFANHRPLPVASARA